MWRWAWIGVVLGAIVSTAELHGMGPIGGVTLGWSTGSFTIGVELRLAQMLITDATPAHLIVTGPADGAGTIPVTDERTSLHPTIATLAATVRLSSE